MTEFFGFAFGCAFISAIVWGWALNIMALASMNWEVVGIEAILRIGGIVVVPLGVIMGFFV